VLLALSFSPGEGAEERERNRQVSDEVVVLKRQVGDVIATSDSLNNVGWEALLRGELDLAAVYLEEALEIAREIDDTFRMTLAIGNLSHLAVRQQRYADAVDLARECLLLCIRRGDHRGGSEAVLALAAAAGGVGVDELSVRLDAIQRALLAERGIVYEPALLEEFEPLLSLARTRLGSERVAELKAELGEPSLGHALELLKPSQSTGPPLE
jgi:hypothetical protein